MTMAVEYKVNVKALHRLRGLLIAEREQDISWQDLADQSGVSPNTLSGILNNRSSGSLDTVQRLVDTFNRYGIKATYQELLDRVPA